MILANVVFLVTSAVVTREQFLAWGWRVPFLASAMLVAVGLFVRTRVAESPVFADVKQRGAELRMPILDVLRRHRRTVPLAAGSYLSSSALGYIAIVYFVSYATRELALGLTTTLTVLAVNDRSRQSASGASAAEETWFLTD